ncbi:GerAB/ArcD/ProY family transporter [Thermocaproicibacter melissae]|uniref:GerAB/ArcD/ProY family transporter n=1 Tax=Thermocaproicibacter melissae TaxID=2966552 RepID=UPI0024B11C58|nr:endospore germination permease [Thermocaproicibacter melissae]WBY64424.1 endospore germination permease [Thermocaproicibacter melissae]
MNRNVPARKIWPAIALCIIERNILLGANTDARQDSWICMAIATVAGLLFAWLFSAVLRLHPGKNMFDIFVEEFGNIGGKIVCVLYTAYASYLGARVFSICNNFIRIVNLDETPTAAIILFSAPLVAGVVKCGLRNMADCSKPLFLLLLIMTGITILLGLNFMDFGNIQPILETKPDVLMSTSFEYLLLAFGETVLCMSFFSEVDKRENPFHMFAQAILVGGGFLTAVILRNILLVGASTADLFLFTSFDAVGIISLGDFVTRISVIVGVEMTLTSIAKIGLCTYSGALGLAKALDIKHALHLAAPLCALMSALSFTLYHNVLTEFEFERYLVLISVPFQIILPLAVLITGKIKQKSKKKKTAAKKAAAVRVPAPEE